ncbi:low molecular weight protein-tyrosine-phosphatase [Alloalcanivorax mobilis]|mgnify:CR=1 FL=1|uniref:low molecular weight protein-tyrosine-phosphatase n=1 Tax=Alloalcanivorax mobilis TaxID=2019569 RepID=UPI000B5B1C54|nr:low molecular weight protein-tyrosine-phosphatase [Alloalcanivorax mobilis]ASK33616.1 protein tyrosine phosphatase [Alcanivorax sp. N3-2A]|tara:strand:+ start:5778 stop:6206 length:429 start_codon:yes stop_codon:yes gene_type:complete
MFERVLVVCDGNICRSPTVAAMLAALKPEKRVHSAGLVGLEGHAMDATARAVAETNGVVCGEHAGRRLTAALCRDADLILVMETRQRDRIISEFPQASGKTFLLTHWNGGHDIPDPFQRDREVFERIYPMMRQAVDAWAAKI